MRELKKAVDALDQADILLAAALGLLDEAIVSAEDDNLVCDCEYYARQIRSLRLDIDSPAESLRARLL